MCRSSARQWARRLARWIPLLGLVGAGCGAPQAPRPDVVLITLDTTRSDHLGAYGSPRPNSPHLDAFARDAIVYERAWSTAPWTLPAHASMLTGKHPTSHGAHFDAESGNVNLGQAWGEDTLSDIRANRLAEEETTLAELLRDRGYATAVFAGGPWLAPAFGLLQGYELRDADVRELNGRSAESLTDAALAWLQRVPADRPLHLLVNYFDPHAPYEPPEEFTPPASEYAIDEADLPDPEEHPLEALASLGKGRLGLAAQRRYDGEIRYTDHHLGRLLDALRGAGRFENALIVVTSDHGELFGEHGQLMHGNWHYEELLRVPLIVRLSGGRGSGSRVQTPVSLVDLLPMIAAEAGLALPDDVEGVAVGEREWVLAESFPDPRSVALYGDDFDRSLATGIRWPWKLTRDSRGPHQLYRLDDDPGEASDLASSRGAQADALVRELERARSTLSPPPQRATPDDVSPETVESLRALGYIE